MKSVTDDVSLDYSKYRKQPRLRVRLPKVLLDRLTLDGKPLVEQPGWANEGQQEAETEEAAEIARARRQKQLWRESGLIGALEDGDADLSAHYKQYVAEYFNEKYK
jgi:hypothetical protein